jgi:hypothetical protein
MLIYAKKEKIRDAKYLETMRGQRCSASALLGCYGDVVAAHNSKLVDGGKGTKASDCFVSPLCFSHHTEEHNRGVDGLWHTVFQEDTLTMHEYRRDAQLWRYAAYLFREKRGNELNKLFRDWGK